MTAKGTTNAKIDVKCFIILLRSTVIDEVRVGEFDCTKDLRETLAFSGLRDEKRVCAQRKGTGAC